VISVLKQLWNAWRRALEREENRWQAQSGLSADREDGPEASCESRDHVKSLAELVQDRQMESNRRK
jgi:hypothetical protein